MAVRVFLLCLVINTSGLFAQTKQERQAVYYAIQGDWIIVNPVAGWKYLRFEGWRVLVNGNEIGTVYPLPNCSFIIRFQDCAMLCTFAPSLPGCAVMTLTGLHGARVVLCLVSAEEYFRDCRKAVRVLERQ